MNTKVKQKKGKTRASEFQIHETTKKESQRVPFWYTTLYWETESSKGFVGGNYYGDSTKEECPSFVASFHFFCAVGSVATFRRSTTTTTAAINDDSTAKKTNRDINKQANHSKIKTILIGTLKDLPVQGKTRSSCLNTNTVLGWEGEENKRQRNRYTDDPSCLSFDLSSHLKKRKKKRDRQIEEKRE